MAPSLSVVLLLLLTHHANSQDSAAPDLVPRGCGWGLVRPYTLLCDLDSIWGVAVESVAAGGVLASILLALVLLCRLRHISQAEKRSGVGPILLLLLGILGLFSLSFAYLIEQDEALCLLRRALWGLLFAVCFSCLLVQGVRLRRMGQEHRSPGGCALTGLALGLSAVQGIIAAEWILLTVLREGRAACQYLPLDFSLACSYVPTAPDYFDTSQNSTRMRETSFDEDIPLSHRQFVENQGYGYSDENTAGLRSGGSAGQHSSNTGARPSAPFRSNVYQPTEMTMILNGGAVPSAPPTYTGRQLW
ncbi:unnamed protein product [Lampetra planeri]